MVTIRDKLQRIHPEALKSCGSSNKSNGMQVLFNASTTVLHGQFSCCDSSFQNTFRKAILEAVEQMAHSQN